MYAFKRVLTLTLVCSFSLYAAQSAGKYQLAEKISDEALQSWNISVFPDGKNLPDGKGNYQSGKKLYDNLCMACHGIDGKGGIKLDPYRGAIDTLVKVKGDKLTGENPKKSIGTYWQYAPLLFDYIRRTMPYQAPKSLSNDEVYALTAYLLAENGIISKKTIISKENLAKVKMPNVNGFICDNRVDTKNIPCMKNCPLPDEKGFNEGAIPDKVDHLKSDCLVQPNIKFEGK